MECFKGSQNTVHAFIKLRFVSLQSKIPSEQEEPTQIRHFWCKGIKQRSFLYYCMFIILNPIIKISYLYYPLEFR